MPGGRRDFLGSLLAVGIGGRVEGTGSPVPRSPFPVPQSMSWPGKIQGTHRAVFDNPRDDGTAVVVLRHGAVTLAMNDAFWAR
jgi:hypothetical protein